MSNWLRPSIFWRLLGIEFVSLSLVWCLGAGLLVHGVYRVGNGVVDDDLRFLANALARLSSTTSDADRIRMLAEQVRGFNSENPSRRVATDEFAWQVWTSDGRLLARSVDHPSLEDLAPGSLPAAQRAERPGWLVIGQASPDGRIYAVVGQAQTYYERFDDELLLGQILWPYLTAILIMMPSMWIKLRIGLRPLRLLSSRMSGRAESDLSALELPRPHAELVPLVDGFNGKIDRIRALIARDREFFADAAHTLRTPLAAIGAQAHVLAHEQRSATRRAALRELEVCIERAAGVVQHLLQLARLERADGMTGFKALDLRGLALDELNAQRHRAAVSGHRLQLAEGSSVFLHGDHDALVSALANMVDNAIRYTPPGTTIVVEVESRPKAAIVRVSDDGPGIPLADRERAFERFERLGAVDDYGSGLGLAVVRRVAELHGGTAELATGADGRGCIVEVALPQLAQRSGDAKTHEQTICEVPPLTATPAA